MVYSRSVRLTSGKGPHSHPPVHPRVGLDAGVKIKNVLSLSGIKPAFHGHSVCCLITTAHIGGLM